MNEKLTRSALRREFLFEEEDDDYIMPCSQLPNPSANGEVFWNYNASPATARARAVLEKKMRLLDDDDKGRKMERKNESAPSPLLTIPMFPARKAASSTSDKEKQATELKKKNEADAMLNSMKQIFQAELQKHEKQFKVQSYDEGNDGNIGSSGSSTERMSDLHLHCSSSGSPLSSASAEMLNKKSNPSDQFNPIRSESENRLKESKDINKSLKFEDDDSFLVRASQAVELLNRSTIENVQKVESLNNEGFGDDDDFDILLSQMEMPAFDQKSKPSNPGGNTVIRNTQKHSTTALTHNHGWSTMSDDLLPKVCLFQVF